MWSCRRSSESSAEEEVGGMVDWGAVGSWEAMVSCFFRSLISLEYLNSICLIVSACFAYNCRRVLILETSAFLTASVTWIFKSLLKFASNAFCILDFSSSCLLSSSICLLISPTASKCCLSLSLSLSFSPLPLPLCGLVLASVLVNVIKASGTVSFCVLALKLDFSSSTLF